MDLQQYLEHEYPDILEEYKRYSTIPEINLQRGVKLIALTSGYGGFGGQELIVMERIKWNGKRGLSLSDIQGNRYVCYDENFHKELRIVDKFSDDNGWDWNIEDIETKEE